MEIVTGPPQVLVNMDSSQHGPTPTGSLGKIPKELRDVVYGMVFAAGKTTLLRASKALWADSKDALFKHAVYRTVMEYDDVHNIYRWDRFRRLRPSNLTNIQNIHVVIRWFIDDEDSDRCFSCYSQEKILNGLIGSMQNTKSCKLSFAVRNLAHLREKSDALESMVQLRAVEKVDVAIWMESWSVRQVALPKEPHVICFRKTKS